VKRVHINRTSKKSQLKKLHFTAIHDQPACHRETEKDTTNIAFLMSGTKRSVNTPSDSKDGNGQKRLQSMEPDEAIIVGGKTFHHYSQVLCHASECTLAPY
jgi:hypothetical protein